jgi:hypothetical protein
MYDPLERVSPAYKAEGLVESMAWAFEAVFEFHIGLL